MSGARRSAGTLRISSRGPPIFRHRLTAEQHEQEVVAGSRQSHTFQSGVDGVLMRSPFLLVERRQFVFRSHFFLLCIAANNTSCTDRFDASRSITTSSTVSLARIG